MFLVELFFTTALHFVPRETFFFSTRVHLPTNTIRAFISLGETPEIREACPIVFGKCFFNFCFASVDRDCSSS